MSATTSERSTGTLFLRALLPVAILAGSVLAYVAISQWLRQVPRLDEESKRVPTAIVATARAHEEGMTLEADGIVVPYREIKISAEVPGRITERAEICRAGNYVKQGQVLATIDPQDYQLEVDRLKNELQQAEVALDELSERVRGAESLIGIATQDLALRTSELTRLKKLGRTAISVSDLEKTEMAELAAQNALLTLRNRVQLLNVGRARLEGARDLSELQLKKARLDLQRTKIVAPADGVIVADFIEKDAYVQRGSPLLTLEDTSKAEVKCKLQMEDLYWLWDRAGGSLESSAQGAPTMPAAPPTSAEAYDIPDLHVDVVYRLVGHNDLEYVWSGRLERYDGLGLDENTRTVPCRVVVDQPLQRTPIDRTGPPALLRGMYVTIRLQLTPKTPLLQIPEEAVRPGNQVWCIRAGKLAIVPVNFVTLLKPADNSAQDSRLALVYVDDPSLPGALTAGDQVIVSPLNFVRTGMAMRGSQVMEQASP